MAARLYFALAFTLSTSVAATAQNGVDFQGVVQAVDPALVIIEARADVSSVSVTEVIPGILPQSDPNLRGFTQLGTFDSGSRVGFAVAENLLITALIPNDQTEVKFVTRDGEQRTGQVVARDHVAGLAAIRTENTSFPALTIAGEAPAVGSPVLVCSAKQEQLVYRASMIASDASPFHPPFGFTQQLDIAFAPELTGSVVVSGDGTIVGVVAFANGAALLIPAEHVQRLVEVASQGEPNDLFQGVLGVALADPATVQSVMPDTPAENAGLVSGDVISRVNGIRCDTFQDIMAAVAMSRGGDEMTIEIGRGDETVEHKLKLKPIDPPAQRPRYLQSIPQGISPRWVPFGGPAERQGGPMIDQESLRKIIEELKDSLGQPEN